MIHARAQRAVRDFEEEVRSAGSVQDYLAWWRGECMKEVWEEHLACLSALAAFRGMHLGIADR